MSSFHFGSSVIWVYHGYLLGANYTVHIENILPIGKVNHRCDWRIYDISDNGS